MVRHQVFSSPLFLAFIGCLISTAIAMNFHKRDGIVTPFGNRMGHNFMWDYDYIAANKSYLHAGIAVYIDLHEIAFAKYGFDDFVKKKNCVLFQTLSGPTTVCDEFFMIVDDWYLHDRKQWDKDCSNILEFKESRVALIKYDVMDEKSPKFIGTYYNSRDRLVYTDHRDKRVSSYCHCI
ncbi:unnamed protein product [Nippostrongylus brasiliensis]|uniref:Group i salivary lipocalin n=1 Tax=Nippostrongylus brasiliensis TaxID=27835 RepID=A0A0N4YR71_NIPBR|nr:unnamed protein product [Nippostrongylus brasiliensis]